MAILRRPARRLVAAGCALVWTVSASPSVAAQRAVEDEVKAGYIVNFVQFVEWPESAWTTPDAPFRICIVGTDPFGDSLSRAIRTEKVGDRPLTIEHPTGSLDRCQVVFAGASEDVRAKELMKAIESHAVLTVGESSAFLEAGGAVAFAIDGGRVRFDVNLRSPAAKDLRVSSKLLRVARNTWKDAR